MMDRHDEEVDRVLQALGAAEPATGLEARVLARLAQAPASTERAPWWSWLAGGLTLAGGLALLYSAAIPRHPVKAPDVIVWTARPAATPSPIVSRAIPPHFRPPALPLHPVRMTQPAVPRQDRGLADLPSSPEPPLPPTDQEKLLLNLAHGPGPLEFALLNPVVRERLAQQSAAEFKQFFPPPTPQELYLAQHTPN